MYKINPKIEKLYLKYRAQCQKYFGCNIDQVVKSHSLSRIYYVYAWRTASEPHKFFYVGKGSGNRFEHITKEISDYEAGKLSGPKADRVKKYKILKDQFGIECGIVLDNLMEGEALIYEYCLKLFLENQGEYILDEEGVSIESFWEYVDDLRELQRPGARIEADGFYDKFTGHKVKLEFDKVELKMLKKVYFYPYFFTDTLESEKKRLWVEKIISYLGGKVNKTLTKNTPVVIVQGRLPEETLLSLKEKGKLIYNIDEIIHATEGIEKKKIDQQNLKPKETDEYLAKRKKATEYIIKMLAKYGVRRDQIHISRYKDEIHISIEGHGTIFLFCYRKKAGWCDYYTIKGQMDSIAST